MHTAGQTASTPPSEVPEFCSGIQYFGQPWPRFDEQAKAAAIASGERAIRDPTDPAAVYQTLLAADALRYLTLQITGTKASGHPGGFASSAEAYSALVMLGHINIVTEVGHHAPGYYSAMFLDTSLEHMGIQTVAQLRARFRERQGLLGHLSGAIPGILSPAGPLGQGQHFAMVGALLHPGVLFPVTIGDGGFGEPYVMSSFLHFHVAYPKVTNFLPVLVWNGYSQEHHAMVSNWTNERMAAYWKAHGFEEVILIDAKPFDDQSQDGAYVDSTRFSFPQRLKFAQAVLESAARAAGSALGGRPTALIVKQLKGAGMHAQGAKSHNLYAQHTLENEDVMGTLRRRALPPQAWRIVRENFARAGGGPAVRTVVTESVLELPALDALPLTEYPRGESKVPSTAMGGLVAEVGLRDRRFVVTNADGNEASGVANINMALKIRHPTEDAIYHQGPSGRVYEPLSEDACAGLAAGGAALRRRPRAGAQRLDPSAPRGRGLLRRAHAQRQRVSALPDGCQYDPGGVRVGARDAQQGHRHLRLQDGAAGAHELRAGAARAGRRRGDAPPERRDGQGDGRVRRGRRHGAAAGVRGEGTARARRLPRAHRRRGEPAPSLPPGRCRLGVLRGAGRTVPERRGVRCALRRRCAHRGYRRRLRDAGARPAPGARPAGCLRLETRRDHGEPEGDHGTQRPYGRSHDGAREAVAQKTIDRINRIYRIG